MDDENLDDFDDLFEPFQLEGGGQDDAPPPPVDDMPTVACPSCGSVNPAHNRHCEQCGARLSQSSLPVAPEPMLRTTAGARALMVLAGVILTVALIALLVNLFRDSPAEETATGDTSPPVESSVPLPAIEQLQVDGIQASSELPGFPASALVDADPENRWNDTQQSGDAFLTFQFNRPVQITSITIQNVTDDEAFRRNFRIKDYQIEIDDLATITAGTLSDTNEAQTITVNSVRTTEVTLRVVSTYAGEPYEGALPYRELALQEVKFFGRYLDEAPAADAGDTTETTG